jgi:hypothetical protein
LEKVVEPEGRDAPGVLDEAEAPDAPRSEVCGRLVEAELAAEAAGLPGLPEADVDDAVEPVEGDPDVRAGPDPDPKPEDVEAEPVLEGAPALPVPADPPAPDPAAPDPPAPDPPAL